MIQPCTEYAAFHFALDLERTLTFKMKLNKKERKNRNEIRRTW